MLAVLTMRLTCTGVLRRPHVIRYVAGRALYDDTYAREFPRHDQLLQGRTDVPETALHRVIARRALVQLAQHDLRALLAFVDRRHRRADSVMRCITHLGDPFAVVPLGLLMLLAPSAPVRDAGTGIAISLASSHLAVQLLKRAIMRPRPDLPVGIVSLIDAPDRFSFPSGHAAASLCVALGLASVLPAFFAGLALGIGLLVGISRCYLGVHYPGDVLAGWILALAGASLAFIV